MEEFDFHHWVRRRQQQQESSSVRRRGREKVYQVGAGAAAAARRRGAVAGDLRARHGYDPDSMVRVHREGYDQLRKERDASNTALDSSYGSGSEMEENSFALEFGQSRPKGSNGMPRKMLIDEDMSKETEIRRSSPSVIAKLMGLDELPPPKVVHKQQKEIGSCFQKTTSAGFQEKFVSRLDHSLQMSTSENQDFKDIFDVMETSKVERDKDVHKGLPRIKKNETNVNFMKQRFTVVKHLSSDEAHRSSKKFSEDLEVFDSDKDLSRKYIQIPNPLLTKHVHDLKHFPPSPSTNRIMNLKSSNISKHRSTERCSKSDGVAESCTHVQKDVASYSRKPDTGLSDHSLQEQSSSLSYKLPKLRYMGNNGTYLHANQIVVLKPRLEKAQNVGRTVPLLRNPDDLSFSHRRLQWSGFQESHAEGKGCQKFSEITDVPRHNRKSSREITRQITNQMQGCVVSNGAKKASVLEFRSHIRDESSRIMSGLSNLHNFEVCLRSSNHCNDWISSSSSSSADSTELSINRDARKRPSDRWKMTHRFKEVGQVHSGASSSDEMFALSDRETQRATLNTRRNMPKSTSCPGSPTDANPNKSERDQINSEENCYMLKDVLNLRPNDSSLGKLKCRGSSFQRSLKSDSNKTKSFDLVGEENKLPVQEIHVNLEEPRKTVHLKIAGGAKANEPDFSNNSMPHAEHLVGNLSAFEHVDCKMPSMLLQDLTSNVAPIKDDDFSDNDQNSLVMEVTSADQHQVVCAPISSIGTESGPPASSKTAEQPSPVSVLELPSSKEKSEVLILSDEDTKGECRSLQQIGDVLIEFRDEEERDFSYLLDILIDSGVYSAAQDRLHNACYSPEYPVGPGLFEKLEKKYSKLVAWSRSERKLLFDLTNCTLAEILAPCLDLHPWVESNRRIGPMWGCEGLVEKVWLMLVRQQKEPSIVIPDEKFLDSVWLVLGDDIDIIGREIERMLKDDLLEELISEFILGSVRPMER